MSNPILGNFVMIAAIARGSNGLLKPRLGRCRSAVHEKKNKTWDRVLNYVRNASECIMEQVSMCTSKWAKRTALPSASVACGRGPTTSCEPFADVTFVVHGAIISKLVEKL